MAAQRVLAELPTVPFNDHLIERLSDGLGMLGYRAPTVGTFVGPEHEGKRMLMQLRPGGPMLPWAEEEAERSAVRAVPSRIDEIIDYPPQLAREVVFG